MKADESPHGEEWHLTPGYRKGDLVTLAREVLVSRWR